MNIYSGSFLHKNSSILWGWATKTDQFHGKGGGWNFVLNRPLFPGNMDIGHRIRGHKFKVEKSRGILLLLDK